MPSRRWRLEDGRPAAAGAEDEVILEEALTVDVAGAGEYVILCTPDCPEALAVGFAFSEGLIARPEDVRRATFERTGPWTSRVRLEVTGSSGVAQRRSLIVSSSCGACGRHIEDALAGPQVGRLMRVSARRLLELAAEMRRRQDLFARTGGAHAALLFSAGGEPAAFAEDIGRHNALDKAIGKMLLAGGLPGGGAVVSGRLSYELVAKAARAGLEIMAGVSAPSSLALDLAGRRGITLCGFVREDRLTAYTHPGRMTV